MDNIFPSENKNDVNNLTTSGISQYEKPDDDNKVYNIVFARNSTAVNGLKSSDISLQYEKTDDDNKVDNIVPSENTMLLMI